MFTIYKGDEVIFIPDTAISALKYNKELQTVTISHKGHMETIHGVDAVNYATSSMPLTLKYKK